MSVEDERKLFVAGLADAVSEEILRQLFETAGGPVEAVTIPRDRATGKPRGFGFVTMASEASARLAREALDGSPQAGRSISVRVFRGDRSQPQPSARGNTMAPPAEDASLYVGNLPFDATAEEIEALFLEAGFTVQRVHLPADPDGRPRGFGFVAFASAEEARQAAEQTQYAGIRGRRLSVNVARARPTQAPPSFRGPSRSSMPAPMSSHNPTSQRDGSSFRPPPATEYPPSDAPPASGWDAARKAAPTWDAEKDKDKKPAKKRKVKGATADRGPQRRKNEGFRAPRARDMLDNWEDE
jgi:RNA recognition motif-containing protein